MTHCERTKQRKMSVVELCKQDEQGQSLAAQRGEGGGQCNNHTGYAGSLGEVEGDLSELLISVGLYVP